MVGVWGTVGCLGLKDCGTVGGLGYGVTVGDWGTVGCLPIRGLCV